MEPDTDQRIETMSAALARSVVEAPTLPERVEVLEALEVKRAQRRRRLRYYVASAILAALGSVGTGAVAINRIMTDRTIAQERARTLSATVERLSAKIEILSDTIADLRGEIRALNRKVSP